MTGFEPAPTVFRHGRSRLNLYQLSYTNKEASYSQVTGGVVGPDKLSARNWLAFWRSVSWIIRRMNLRTKPRKGTGESYQNPPTSQAEFQLRGLLNQRQNAVRPLHLLDHRAVAVALAGIHHPAEPFGGIKRRPVNSLRNCCGKPLLLDLRQLFRFHVPIQPLPCNVVAEAEPPELEFVPVAVGVRASVEGGHALRLATVKQ